MDLLILDGGSTKDGRFAAWIERFVATLESEGHGVRHLRLRDLRIAQCRGCLDCFVKTPGRCRTRDDAEDVQRAYIGADLVVLASPVTMGFVSVLLKRALERLLPLIHPYVCLVDGEIRHRLRYSRYPRLALVRGDEGCDDEDAEIIDDIFREFAKETRTKLVVAASTAAAPEEVSHALGRV